MVYFNSFLICPRCSRNILNSTISNTKTFSDFLPLSSISYYTTAAPRRGPEGCSVPRRGQHIGDLLGQRLGGLKGQHLVLRGLRTWSDETHYSVLGVGHEATQDEIRSAYLRLSKQLHPDYNVGKNAQETENIHNKFVKINTAYSVIGNKKQRRLYDLEVLMQEDPRWRGGNEDIRTNSPHQFHSRPMSYEERVQSMGFKKPDPNFYAKHGNYHQRVVLWCIVFIAVGILVQGTAIMALYTRHSAQLDIATANNTMLLVTARSNARNYSTVQEQLDHLNLSYVKAPPVKPEAKSLGYPLDLEGDAKSA